MLNKLVTSNRLNVRLMLRLTLWLFTRTNTKLGNSQPILGLKVESI